MNLLFICSRNKWRSTTAEAIYKDHSEYTVRSAGTEPSAAVRVNARLIAWADIIFVMEKVHKERILEKFREELISKKIVILDIEDDYQFMDPELVEMILVSVEGFMGLK